jgi:Right handed beta helix region
MTRIIAKLFAVAVVFTAFLPFASVYAAGVTYVSSTGDDANPCTAAQPCKSFIFALDAGLASGGQISCLNSPAPPDEQIGLAASLTIDCAGVYDATIGNQAAFRLHGTNQVVKIRNLTFSGAAGGYPAISATGSGTLILENCVFENFNASGAGPALDIEPTGTFSLVIKNSRVSNGSSVGIILKPASGGSINATFDHVTVTENGAAGIRLDTTNGPATVDLTDSVIFNNGGNGFGVTSGAGQAVVSITRSVIAKNAGVGVAANGPAAGVMIDATLLDSNSTATSAASGGHILTYGNNRIVGPAGSGFTGPASLQ